VHSEHLRSLLTLSDSVVTVRSRTVIYVVHVVYKEDKGSACKFVVAEGKKRN